MNLRLYKLRLHCLIFLISICAINTGVAQNSSLELWPESDIWFRLNPSWRFSSYIAITKYFESKDRDLNITLQADYAWGHAKNPYFGRLQDERRGQSMKTWLLRAGFMEGRSLHDHGENYNEEMAIAEIHKRVPIKNEGLLSLRFRTDYRWLGSNSDFSYRLRFRMMFEKEFKSGRRSFVPYINAEPFWDSRYSIVNRFRIIGGSTVSWGDLLAFEGNFTYQYDSKSSIENVYALNIILHLFFEKNHPEIKKASNEQPWFDLTQSY
jgi:hypothetical protein